MTLALTNGHLNTPFVDAKGNINPIWVKWLQNATQAINSPIGLVHQHTQADLPTDLQKGNTGYLAYVSDYGHLLTWTGTAWAWAPGELGSDYVEAFLSGPTGAGWHLCDGSVVQRLNADGTLTAVTLPDLSTAAYLKLGTAAAAGPNAPAGQSGGTSGGTPAGVVSQPTFTGNLDTTSAESAGTPAGSVTQPAATGTESGDVTVQSGGGTTVAAQNHTHGLSNPTFTGAALAAHQHTLTPDGTVSQPTFAGAVLAAHTHAPGSIDLENTQLLAYYRQ